MPRHLRPSGAIDTLAVVWNQTASFMFVTVQPLLVGALVDAGGYGLALAGRMIAANMAGCFVGALSAIWLLRLVGVKKLIALGTTVIAVGSIGAGLSLAQPATFALAQIVAGLGIGVAISSGASSASAFARPERMFASIMIGQMVTGSVILLIGPDLLQTLGIAGCLFGLALLSATQLLFLDRFVQPPAPHSTGSNVSRRSRTGLVLLSFLLFSIGNGGVYPNLERFAQLPGMSAGWMGPALALTQVFGLVGSMLAIWVGARMLHSRAIMLACGMIAGATIAMALMRDPLTMTTSSAIFAGAIGFGVPFYFGALASADATGRMIVAGQLTMLLGFAIGPFFAGIIGEAGSMAMIATAAVALFLAALGVIGWHSRSDAQSMRA